MLEMPGFWDGKERVGERSHQALTAGDRLVHIRVRSCVVYDLAIFAPDIFVPDMFIQQQVRLCDPFDPRYFFC